MRVWDWFGVELFDSIDETVNVVLENVGIELHTHALH